MLYVDHLQISAKDAKRSAEFLASILGAPPPVADGVDDDMFRVDLDHESFILVLQLDRIEFTHVAFRVDEARFKGIVERLREKKVPFGNDHRDTTNGKADDPIPGGIGRVYFVDENQHLLEVTWR
jgi:catechol 2,3-dioxygenase-like lactoylglutathione lyase family enzyme